MLRESEQSLETSLMMDLHKTYPVIRPHCPWHVLSLHLCPEGTVCFNVLLSRMFSQGRDPNELVRFTTACYSCKKKITLSSQTAKLGVVMEL